MDISLYLRVDRILLKEILVGAFTDMSGKCLSRFKKVDFELQLNQSSKSNPNFDPKSIKRP